MWMRKRERDWKKIFQNPVIPKKFKQFQWKVFKSCKVNFFKLTLLWWLLSFWLEYCGKSHRALERNVLMPHSKLGITKITKDMKLFLNAWTSWQNTGIFIPKWNFYFNILCCLVTNSGSYSTHNLSFFTFQNISSL